MEPKSELIRALLELLTCTIASNMHDEDGIRELSKAVHDIVIIIEND